VLNLETSKANIIVTLATDIILLLIMLIGLLRLRVQGAGMFGLWRLLWRQVGSLLAMVPRICQSNVCPKGIIWLLIATAAEVPPTVRLDRFSCTFGFSLIVVSHRRSSSV
jgi:hypothetical protein